MEKETFATMTIGDAKAVYKAAKGAKAKVTGLINLTFTDRMEGLNIRSVYGKAKGMFTVFDNFTRQDTEKLRKPVFDFKENTVVATNGSSMLLCDIPSGMTKEVAESNGFADNKEVDLRWWVCMDHRDHHLTEEGLASKRCIAVIERGGSLHNTLMAMAECAKAYEFTDKKGCWHTLYGQFGDKVYNIRAIAKLVTALFKLGNTKVGLYECLNERLGYGLNGEICDYTPMHIVGMDGGNHSRGLIMPMRTGTGMEIPEGKFVFPIIDKAANAA